MRSSLRSLIARNPARSGCDGAGCVGCGDAVRVSVSSPRELAPPSARWLRSLGDPVLHPRFDQSVSDLAEAGTPECLSPWCPLTCAATWLPSAMVSKTAIDQPSGSVPSRGTRLPPHPATGMAWMARGTRRHDDPVGLAVPGNGAVGVGDAPDLDLARAVRTPTRALTSPTAPHLTPRSCGR